MFVFGNIVDWWRSYGGRAIELQRFAKRVVSLCASSSGCERNWSTFEFVSFSPSVISLLFLPIFQQAFYSSFWCIVFLIL